MTPKVWRVRLHRDGAHERDVFPRYVGARLEVLDVWRRLLDHYEYTAVDRDSGTITATYARTEAWA